MKKIYLAGPYSHQNMHVKAHRFNKLNIAAAKLMLDGFMVFSPISHTHPIALAGDLPGGWEFWEEYDKTFIEWCDELHILKLAGWTESTGVQAEIEIAQKMDKPIVFIKE
jgi:hypothetical protein